MAIDVGAPCIDRALAQDDYTSILAANPANATGTIDHIDYWCAGLGSVVDIASFYEVSDDVFSTRGYVEDLTVSSGDNDLDAPGDFTAFDINAGDYIGFYAPVSFSALEKDDSGGVGFWFAIPAADHIPCTEQTFGNFAEGYELSLYATGIEAGATYTKTFDVDVFLKATLVKNFTVDAFLEGILVKEFSIDGYLVNRLIKDFTIDSILKGTFTKDFLIDAFLEKSFTKDFLIDAILSGVAIYTKDFTIDALLKGTLIKDFTIDAIISGLEARTKTFLVDAVIGGIFTKVPLWQGKKYKVIGIKLDLKNWKMHLDLKEL